MTRVVLQRGQGSSSSGHVRTSSSAISSSPNPQPVSTHPANPSSLEENPKEPRECVLQPWEDLPNVTHDSNDKLEGAGSSDNDKASAEMAISDGRGRDILSTSRYGLVSEEEGKVISCINRHFEIGSSSRKPSMQHGECVLEEPQSIMQVEGPGLPKEPCCDASCIGDSESKNYGMQPKVEGVPALAAESSAGVSGGSSSQFQAVTGNQTSSSPACSFVDSGSQWTELTASLPLSTLPAPSFTLPTSKRGGWGSSTTSNLVRAGSGSSRKAWRTNKSSKSPPQSSRSSPPRSYVEADGYNSADEQNPWTIGQRGSGENDDRERQFEAEIRRARGLEVRRMVEDGNCLFRAVADQVYGDPEMYGETRQMCIDYMEKERDHFSQFVTESFSAYCKRKRRDRVFGNDLEIQAMAEMYNRPILIFCYGSEPKNIFQGSYQTDLPPIRLSYHRNNHYNSLVDPCRPTIGAGLGFGSLHGANVDRDQVKAAIKAQQDVQIDKALLAEGRYYSDLELTEQEMERMVIEASRAEFLAGEYGHQFGGTKSSTSAGTSTSQGDRPSHHPQPLWHGSTASSYSSPTPTTTPLTANMRMLLSMGFSYVRVVEAHDIFGDDINDMLCYLLEADTSGLFDDSVHRLKGKAAEK